MKQRINKNKHLTQKIIIIFLLLPAEEEKGDNKEEKHLKTEKR